VWLRAGREKCAEGLPKIFPSKEVKKEERKESITQIISSEKKKGHINRARVPSIVESIRSRAG